MGYWWRGKNNENFEKCYDNGLRKFDTADVYSNGELEVLLENLLRNIKYQEKALWS